MEKTKVLAKDLKSDDKVEKILFVVALVGVLSLLLNIIMQFLFLHTSIRHSLPFSQDIFSDFAEVMAYCFNPRRYETGIIYPPIAYLIYIPFGLICKNHALDWINGTIGLRTYSEQTSTIVAFVLYFAISTALLLFVVAKISKFRGKKLTCLLISVVCFGPYFYAFCRGNIIINCLTLLLVFFWLYKSEKKWQREIANVCLGLVMALKIYPVFLLVFFIKDRRFLDMLKSFLYGAVFLFLPFLFIKGGFYNVPLMWNNCFGFKDQVVRTAAHNNISFDSLFSHLNLLLIKIFGRDMAGFTSLLTSLSKYSLILGTIILFACSKKSKLYMQVISLSIFCYILFQNVSYGYAMVYLIIPILIYFMNFDSLSKLDKWFYGICYALIAFPLFYTFLYWTLQSAVMFVMVIKCVVDLIIDDVKIHKQTKLEKQTAATKETKTDKKEVEQN